jgi:alpha-L-fucosidase
MADIENGKYKSVAHRKVPEWCSRKMHNKTAHEFEYHRKTYGEQNVFG